MKNFFLTTLSVYAILAVLLSLFPATPALAAASGPVDGTFNPSAPGANNYVWKILSLPNGQYLVGGGFTGYNSGSPVGIMRLNADGTLDDTFNPGIGVRGVGNSGAGGSYVQAIALQTQGGETKILLGGKFNLYNGVASPINIMRLHMDGTVDGTFVGQGFNATGEVDALAVQPDGRILVGGSFSSYTDGIIPTPANAPDNILRLNADGTLDQTFNYVSTLPTPKRGTNSAVWAITLQPDGQILVGGNINNYTDGLVATPTDAPDGIIRLNALNGSLDTSFNTGSGLRGLRYISDPTNFPSGSAGIVYSIVLQGSRILAGGFFNAHANGITSDLNASDGVLRLNADGSLDTTFNYGANLGAGNGLQVNSIGLQSDGQIIIGGSFTSYNNDATVSDYLLRLAANGAIGTGFNAGNSGFNNVIMSVLVQGGDDAILAGGFFTAYNGASYPGTSVPAYILRLNDVLPTVTINQASGQADPATTSPINFRVIFSVPVTGFGDAAGDVSLSGTAGAATVVFTEVAPNDGTTYNVAVSGMTSSGTVTAVVAANAVLGGNQASTGGDNTVRYALAGTAAAVKSLPSTGFRPGQITVLPSQPLEKAYAGYDDLKIEIPSIKVEIPIVGVPLIENGWDVSWLGTNAGWLNGSAFPTWSGNSVITGHVWDAGNQPGPFVHLKNLKYGDQVRIHAWGQVYTYEVRENRLVSPKNSAIALQHEDMAWVTLLTCEDYSIFWNTYSFRRMVRAVLVKVSAQQ